MPFIRKGIQDTLSAIKRKKGVFIGILVLQLIFILILSMLLLHYQIKILTSAKEVIEPLQNANYNPESLQEGDPFIEDIGSVYQSYNDMIKHIILFELWGLLLFLISGAWIWVGTQALLNKKKQSAKVLLKQWGKFVGCSFIVLIPIYLILFLVMKRATQFSSINSINNILIGIAVITIVTHYILSCLFAFINLRFKQVFKNMFNVAVKKIYKTIIVAIINLILIGASLYFIYITTIKLNSLVILSTFLFIIILVLTRIFWVASLREIANEKNNS